MFVVTGMERAGSTFVWQVAKEFGNTTKVHGFYTPANNMIALATYRDPRDAICSYAGAFDITLEEAFITLFVQRKRHLQLLQARYFSGQHHLIRYEDYFGGNEAQLVKRIAELVRADLSEEQANNIAVKHSIKENKKIADTFTSFKEHDKKTQIHGRHITNNGKIGTWKARFPDALTARVNSYLMAMLIAFNYEE